VLTHASHYCNLGMITSISMQVVIMVTKLDRSVSKGYSGFLPHKRK